MTRSAAGLSLRGFLSGHLQPKVEPPRPPWSDAASILSGCTACGACIEACPQEILSAGSGGHPVLSFAERECTFCGACAEACPEPVFTESGGPAFTHRAAIGRDCLAVRKVHCQTCGDACPEAAIRFQPRLGGPPLPGIDEERCTGCGACVAVCPAEAVAIRSMEEADG